MGRGRTVGVSYTETRPGQTVPRWLSGYLPFGCADDPGSSPDAVQLHDATVDVVVVVLLVLMLLLLEWARQTARPGAEKPAF